MSTSIYKQNPWSYVTPKLNFLAKNPQILHMIRSYNDAKSLHTKKTPQEWYSVLQSCCFQKDKHPLLSRAEHLREVAQHVTLEHKIQFLERITVAKLPECSSIVEILSQTLTPQEVEQFIETLVKLDETHNTTFSQLLDRMPNMEAFLLHCLSSEILRPHLNGACLVECLKKIPPSGCFSCFERCIQLPSAKELPVSFWKALLTQWHTQPEAFLQEFLTRSQSFPTPNAMSIPDNVWIALNERIKPQDMPPEVRNTFLEQTLLPTLERSLEEQKFSLNPSSTGCSMKSQAKFMLLGTTS